MLAALIVIFQVASVTEVASPRPNGWVTDQANVISAEAEAKLDAIAGELHTLRGIELAVVTVDSVPGTPKQFATDLFNHWKIGSAATNNGVLVVIGRRITVVGLRRGALVGRRRGLELVSITAASAPRSG